MEYNKIKNADKIINRSNYINSSYDRKRKKLSTKKTPNKTIKTSQKSKTNKINTLRNEKLCKTHKNRSTKKCNTAKSNGKDKEKIKDNIQEYKINNLSSSFNNNSNAIIENTSQGSSTCVNSVLTKK